MYTRVGLQLQRFPRFLFCFVFFFSTTLPKGKQKMILKLSDLVVRLIRLRGGNRLLVRVIKRFENSGLPYPCRLYSEKTAKV